MQLLLLLGPKVKLCNYKLKEKTLNSPPIHHRNASTFRWDIRRVLCSFCVHQACCSRLNLILILPHQRASTRRRRESGECCASSIGRRTGNSWNAHRHGILGTWKLRGVKCELVGCGVGAIVAAVKETKWKIVSWKTVEKCYFDVSKVCWIVTCCCCCSQQLLPMIYKAMQRM